MLTDDDYCDKCGKPTTEFAETAFLCQCDDPVYEPIHGLITNDACIPSLLALLNNTILK